MKCIGNKIENKKYTNRPGAYAIIVRKIEQGETPIEALKREMIEETGYGIKNIKEFDQVSSYLESKTRGPLYVEAEIYIAELDKKVTEAIEKDHKML